MEASMDARVTVLSIRNTSEPWFWILGGYTQVFIGGLYKFKTLAECLQFILEVIYLQQQDILEVSLIDNSTVVVKCIQPSHRLTTAFIMSSVFVYNLLTYGKDALETICFSGRCENVVLQNDDKRLVNIASETYIDHSADDVHTILPSALGGFIQCINFRTHQFVRQYLKIWSIPMTPFQLYSTAYVYPELKQKRLRSLQDLCTSCVIRHNLCTSQLPYNIQRDMYLSF